MIGKEPGADHHGIKNLAHARTPRNQGGCAQVLGSKEVSPLHLWISVLYNRNVHSSPGVQLSRDPLIAPSWHSNPIHLFIWILEFLPRERYLSRQTLGSVQDESLRLSMERLWVGSGLSSARNAGSRYQVTKTSGRGDWRGQREEGGSICGGHLEHQRMELQGCSLIVISQQDSSRIFLKR